MTQPHRTLTPLIALLPCLIAATAAGQATPEEIVLDNGMKFLLLPRRFEPGAACAGWVAKVGSADERPGVTGLNIFIDHLLRQEPTRVAGQNVVADLQYLQKLEELGGRLRQLHLTVQQERMKTGEIDDPWDPANDTEEMSRLRAELLNVVGEHEKIIVHNIYEKTYTDAGAGDLRAFASHDLTFHSITLPGDQLELWAHLEAQRLDKPVFRKFRSEHAAAGRRRAMTIQATPTGALDAEFDELFWDGSPYAWPVAGRTGDLESVTREQLVGFFRRYYQPGNLVGVIVGDFQPEQIKPILAETFGKLESGGVAPPAPPAVAARPESQRRLTGQCNGPPRIEVRHHTVPFDHPDTSALEVMAELLNAPQGRLRRLLAAEQPLAAGVRAGQISRRLGGCFYFIAEPAGSVSAEDLERAWDAELQRLRTEPVPSEEMELARQRIRAGTDLQRQSNRDLLFQFGVYEAMGGWEHAVRRADRLLAVTPEDVMRVANAWFDPAGRYMAVYERRVGGAASDNPLANLSPQLRSQFEQTLARLLSYDRPEDLRRAADAFEASLDRTPEEIRPAMEYLVQRLRQRIAELEADRNP